ncbi:HNH endonuclease signature motif containing protein [Krasilnikoviella flava]|uniref:HNH endonuclease n=1 Tax=Krasilnikoviella flava TaxID=526729 RepID=A0A1T5M1I9_9MICO|nr:HNH endonuclease signature motif containing protein [Krasilnikoviella flava]SKC81894.1 HNH endonuclease [Krasilnikoviella flava]
MFDAVAAAPRVHEPPPAGPSLARVSAAIDEVVEIQRQVDALEARKLVAAERARALAERAESALLADDDVELSRAGATRRRDLARRAFTADLATALHLTEQAAAHLLDTARTLAVGPGEAGRGTLDALWHGRLTLAHATAVADTLADLPDPDARARVEAAVLPRATTCTVPQLRRHLRRARDLAHPETLAERHRRAAESRAIYVDPGADGMAWLTAHLPAHVAHAAYDRLTRAGRQAKEAGDSRTLAQLRADGVADLLLAGAGSGTDGQGSVPDLAEIARRITPTVRVTVPVLSLLGRSDAAADLDGHGPVDAATASTLAAAAPSLRRLLVDPVDSRVLTTDPGTYSVPAALRAFLRARDGVCRFPGCTRAAARCDVDHVVAWVDGGRTVADNLTHLCRHHHVLKHQSSWRSRLDPDGTLTWTSPTGRTYDVPPEPSPGVNGSRADVGRPEAFGAPGDAPRDAPDDG